MGDESRKFLSFGPLELSIGSRLLTNGAKTVPLGARRKRQTREGKRHSRSCESLLRDSVMDLTRST
jgi:hypothetical protein